MYRFQQYNNRLPNPRCNKDADAVIQIAKEINKTLETKVSKLYLAIKRAEVRIRF